MKLPWRRGPQPIYAVPSRHAHRGFAYLDDDIVINSLSALESGKVDEVVEKINLAQERGMSVGLRLGTDKIGASADGSGKATESLQAEVIRRRTRFSIFELWYEALRSRNAIGRFEGWGNTALDSVRVGDVIEIRGRIELVPLQTALRMFLWFVNEVRSKNPMFAKGTDLNALTEQEKIVKFLLGRRDEINATLSPVGDPGPAVGISFLNEWIIEPVGRWNGTYSVIAQVEEVLPAGEAWQTMRIIEDAPLTPLEKETIENAIEPFRESTKTFGIDMGEDSNAELAGPALVLRPIALFR